MFFAAHARRSNRVDGFSTIGKSTMLIYIGSVTTKVGFSSLTTYSREERFSLLVSFEDLLEHSCFARLPYPIARQTLAVHWRQCDATEVPCDCDVTPVVVGPRGRLPRRVGLESKWQVAPRAAWLIQPQPKREDRESLPDRRSKTIPWSPQSPEAGPPQNRKPASARLFRVRSSTLLYAAPPVRCEFPSPAFVCLPSKKPCRRFPLLPALPPIRLEHPAIPWRRAKRTRRCPFPCPTS